MDPTTAGSRSLLYCKQYIQTFRIQTCKANYAGTRELVGYLSLIWELCSFLLHLSQSDHRIMRSHDIFQLWWPWKTMANFLPIDASWLFCVAYEFLFLLSNCLITKILFADCCRSSRMHFWSWLSTASVICIILSLTFVFKKNKRSSSAVETSHLYLVKLWVSSLCQVTFPYHTSLTGRNSEDHLHVARGQMVCQAPVKACNCL